ncbi:MAG: peptidylprolyl isomerase, partial [Akkermansiaceae bacterium]|nr:peptidylprolyl isomerase [Akkermansiaceae bacterium]
MNPLTMTLAALLALASPLSAQIITADIDVYENGASLGIITIELDHVKAPVATANFIGLATGKFPWIDSTTGVVRQNTPYYNGIIFHRVIAGFMNQTGSQKGDGSDGPGYSFLDGAEVTNGLNHDNAFVISMANSGPNSNGSQIFLTAAPASHLNGIHIVFGKIATGASQTLVTTINNVPVNSNSKPLTDVTIDSITVDYHGVTFDPFAQGLPVVSTPTLSNSLAPSSTTLDFNQPTGSFFHTSYSEDLLSWGTSETRYLDGNDASENSFDLPAEALGKTTHFFSNALVTYD